MPSNVFYWASFDDIYFRGLPNLVCLGGLEGSFMIEETLLLLLEWTDLC